MDSSNIAKKIRDFNLQFADLVRDFPVFEELSVSICCDYTKQAASIPGTEARSKDLFKLLTKLLKVSCQTETVLEIDINAFEECWFEFRKVAKRVLIPEEVKRRFECINSSAFALAVLSRSLLTKPLCETFLENQRHQTNDFLLSQLFQGSQTHCDHG